ncbi:Uncharacterised protein [Bordetella pertussis]|nr:Uncharacterised protein [Bordetella pertussis]
MVSGSSLATSTNASIARSGCSLSRKFRPRKYESGNVRVSRSICRKSKRAASQPSANSTGTNISHQGSKSTARALGRK